MEPSNGEKNWGGGSGKPTSKQHGSCHCGAVRFAVDLALADGGSQCNCSICTKVGGVNVILKPAALTVKSGEDNLSTYEWGPKISKRYFCKTCGVHCFGRGHFEELGGDFVSVNLNCLDDVELAGMKVTYWDGRHNNWDVGPRDKPWPILSA